MPENNHHIDFHDLAIKYLSGNASSAEVQILETRVLEDPAEKEAFMAIKKAWVLSGMQADVQQVPVDALWDRTAAQLFPEAKVVDLSHRKTRMRWLRIAAGFALIALVASILYFQTWGNPSLVVAAEESVQSVALADGSQVTLNQRASLTYTYSKKESERRVKLTGDAFFEVERDEDAPFIIEARMLEIEVLGTSFYVDSREGLDQVQVIVESGRVAVRHQGEEIILTANEMAVFRTDTRQLQKQQNTDENYQSLKTNILVFENTPLEDVLFALNRHYRSNIVLGDPGLADCPITSTFNNKSFEAVLLILDSALPRVDVENTGEEVLLRGVCEE